MAGSIRWTNETLQRNLGAFDDRVQSKLGQTTEYFALRVETTAKTQAPWTDRTTNARSSLAAVARVEKGKFSIVLHHGMWYGVYLEIIADGKWGIVAKTVREQAPEFTRLMTKVFMRAATGQG